MRRRLLASLAATAAVATSLLIGSAGSATAADATAAPSAAAPLANTQESGSASAGRIPADIKVPDGYKIVTTLRGTGKQVYTCTNGAFVSREPVAVLSNSRGTPVGIHGQGPFWAHFDGSKVTATKKAGVKSPTGTANVDWLLLQATPLAGTGGTFANVGWIQRIDTRGGNPPASCSGTSTVAVDYSANYVFWAPNPAT